MGFKTFAANAFNVAEKGAHLAKAGWDKYNELNKRSEGKVGAGLKFLAATAMNHFVGPNAGDLIYSLSADDKSSNWDKAGRFLSNPDVQNFGKKLWNQAKEGLTGVRLHTIAEDKKPVKSINQGKGAIR